MPQSGEELKSALDACFKFHFQRSREGNSSQTEECPEARGFVIKFLELVNKKECDALPGDVFQGCSKSDSVIDHRFTFLKEDGDYNQEFKVPCSLSLFPSFSLPLFFSFAQPPSSVKFEPTQVADLVVGCCFFHAAATPKPLQVSILARRPAAAANSSTEGQATNSNTDPAQQPHRGLNAYTILSRLSGRVA